MFGAAEVYVPNMVGLGINASVNFFGQRPGPIQLSAPYLATSGETSTHGGPPERSDS